jgi:hypothetical protein
MRLAIKKDVGEGEGGRTRSMPIKEIALFVGRSVKELSHPRRLRRIAEGSPRFHRKKFLAES